MKNGVIAINDQDIMMGTMDKLQAHVFGKLHRALSVFIFNSKGELLLQQRALDKYHSGGLWSNTCCSHPRPGEATPDAARRRLMEEMGLDAELTFRFHFTYKEDVGNGLTEHEFDHVFFGISDQAPQPNPFEVADFKYISLEQLGEELGTNPNKYSKWLKLCFEQVLSSYQNYLRYVSITY